jgi:hypothetical protein
MTPTMPCADCTPLALADGGRIGLYRRCSICLRRLPLEHLTDTGPPLQGGGRERHERDGGPLPAPLCSLPGAAMT